MNSCSVKINYSSILFIFAIYIMISSIDINFSTYRINAQKSPFVYNYDSESLEKIKQINNQNQNPISYLSYSHYPMMLQYLISASSMTKFITVSQNQCIHLQEECNR